MAAYIQVEIKLPNDSEARAASRLVNDSTKPEEAIRALVFLLESLQAGTEAGQVAVASKATSASLSGTTVNLTNFSTTNTSTSALNKL